MRRKEIFALGVHIADASYA